MAQSAKQRPTVRWVFRSRYDNSVADPHYEVHVQQMIELVLFTSPGERVNRPEFGCGLLQLIFGPDSEALASATEYLVQTALHRWLTPSSRCARCRSGRPTTARSRSPSPTCCCATSSSGSPSSRPRGWSRGNPDLRRAGVVARSAPQGADGEPRAEGARLGRGGWPARARAGGGTRWRCRFVPAAPEVGKSPIPAGVDPSHLRILLEGAPDPYVIVKEVLPGPETATLTVVVRKESR